MPGRPDRIIFPSKLCRQTRSHRLQGAYAHVTIHFDTLDDERGVRVRDTAEGEQFPLRTDRQVDPTPATTDDFAMPVDVAVAVSARELHVPGFSQVIFWQDGDVVQRAESAEAAERLERGTYEVDFSPPGAQLYVRVEDAAPKAGFADDHSYVQTETPTRLVLGVRSNHQTPAGTVTTTDDPRDVMAAVSTFGSALKTHSPDRSWPTLRGHPPAIEVGDELDVPNEVEPPETGVTIEVPPAYGAIFTVAPLAFYLGATVEAGEQPRLLAGDAEYRFETADLAESVRGVLEHVFTLDSVIRSAGVYPFRTATADELDERVDLDYEALFELPLDERTAAYLDVPRAATEGLLDWHYAADVEPDPAYAAALPYLLDELALVRSPPERADVLDLTPSPDALESADGALVRSTSRRSATPRHVVVPEDANTPGQSWIGDGHAVGAANPTVGAYRRSFDWPKDGGPLDVHVVYNDARLDAPAAAAYDVHSFQETSVTTSHRLTTSELRDVLYDDVDFLHFVGHVTANGLVCSDGELDARTLARTGVKAFFLNGCRSYEQGRALLTAGAIGGIVTVDDVADPTAADVGHKVASLLSTGFPLYGVLDVMTETGVPLARYTALGSGAFGLRTHPSGIALLLEFDTGEFEPESDPIPLSAHRYPLGVAGLGGMTSYLYSDTPANVQSAKETRTTISRSDLSDYLADSGIPVLFDGDLCLTDDLSVEDFR